MRLIDADALIGEINERIEAAIKWGVNAIADGDKEIKLRAEQAVATFCEASLTVKKMPTIDPVKHVFSTAFDPETDMLVAERNGKKIEFVKVVRCQDCQWYEIYQLKKDGTDDRRYKPSYCTLLRHNFKPDWYCADGERKGEEE